ncbi:hypothetical protein GCK32_001348 [Trichostrongylus colubriformis]|uniref:Uncharacterized protein n=1 Tax=Trichostrongylus colubriformis TaxID=6319 RepID=A0AAN8G856_TRICO
MTQSCHVFSVAKALWSRITRQSKWCRCKICRDKILNGPDPLFLSEDAQKLQKMLRQKPKAYKKRKQLANKYLHHGKNCDGMCNFQEPMLDTPDSDSDEARSYSVPPTSTIPQIPHKRDVKIATTAPLATKVEKSVRFAEPLHQESVEDRCGTRESTLSSPGDEETLSTVKRKDASKEYIDYFENRVDHGKYGKPGKESGIKILSSLHTILEHTTSSCSSESAEINNDSDDEFRKEDELNLYEVHLPPKLPQRLTHLYDEKHINSDESMNSYGTITSQELLDAFHKAAQENDIAPLSSLYNDKATCVNESYLHTSLV